MAWCQRTLVNLTVSGLKVQLFFMETFFFSKFKMTFMTNVFPRTFIFSLSIPLPTFTRKNFSYNIFVSKPIRSLYINHSENMYIYCILFSLKYFILLCFYVNPSIYFYLQSNRKFITIKLFKYVYTYILFVFNI